MTTPALSREPEAGFDYLALAGVVQEADVVDRERPSDVSLQQDQGIVICGIFGVIYFAATIIVGVPEAKATLSRFSRRR